MPVQEARVPRELRICYYNRLLNEPWGCGVHAHGLITGWRSAGHEVLCLPASLLSDEVRLDTTVRSLSWLAPVARGPLHDARARLRSIANASRLTALAREFEPDLLVTRRAGYDYCLDAFLRQSALPYVAEVNAVIFDEVRQLSRQKVLPWERCREVTYLRRAAGAVCVTDELRARLSTLGVPKTRSTVLPNGVDLELFAPDTPADADTLEWSRRFDRVYCYSGVLPPTHDTAGLIQAAASMAESHAGLAFLFVGPTCEDLRKMPTWHSVLDSCVRCTGRVPHRLVPGHLAAADIFWASFRNDYGSPLKLYEYMAMGKPVVLAGAGQATEVIHESRCGSEVPRGATDRLEASAIELGSLSDHELATMGAYGRSWVVEGHSWTTVADRFANAARCMASAKV